MLKEFSQSFLSFVFMGKELNTVSHCVCVVFTLYYSENNIALKQITSLKRVRQDLQSV